MVEGAAAAAGRSESERAADLAGNGIQNQYVLAELVADRFSRGLTLNEITDLTIDAMKQGFETPETLIAHFYETYLTRQTSGGPGPLGGDERGQLREPAQSEADRLGMRASVLDAEVAKLRKQHHAQQPAAKEPPQWSPAARVRDTPIAGAALLTELIAAIRRFDLLRFVSVIPVVRDGSKSPAVSSKRYQNEHADRETIRRWFGPHGIAFKISRADLTAFISVRVKEDAGTGARA